MAVAILVSCVSGEESQRAVVPECSIKGNLLVDGLAKALANWNQVNRGREHLPKGDWTW